MCMLLTEYVCAMARSSGNRPAVVPAVDRGTGQTDAAERDVMDGEAHMSRGHDPTITARRSGTTGRRRMSRARLTDAYHARMGQRSNEEIVNAYLRAYIEDDEPAMHALRHPDWMVDYPQSGERIRGHANERAIAANYPGGLPGIATDQVIGNEDAGCLAELHV